MSIVGPRPERKEIAQQYALDMPEFDFRLKVKAGLTGYAQVYGKYNTSPYDKLKMDLAYIEGYSLWLDIKIILMTIKAVSYTHLDVYKRQALVRSAQFWTAGFVL